MRAVFPFAWAAAVALTVGCASCSKNAATVRRDGGTGGAAGNGPGQGGASMTGVGGGGGGGRGGATGAGGTSDGSIIPPPVDGGAGPAFPLKASANGRALVDQNGVPFFMVGDSAQTFIQDMPMASAASYFSTRRSQGFNTVLWELIGKEGMGQNPPATARGDLPFLRGTDGNTYTQAGARTGGQLANFSTPNDTYFAYAASLVDMAASYGFLVVMYPIPWGYQAMPDAGLWADIVAPANSQTVCSGFGQYLARGFGTFTGFASRKNIIWLDGSDYGQQAPTPPSLEGEQRMLQLLSGMVTGGALQMRGGDWEAPSLSTDESVFTSAMTINGVYTYGGTWNGSPGNIPFDGTTYQESRQAWQWQPAIPAFLKETFYEHSTLFSTTDRGTPTALRKWHYWAILGGATTGLLYGNERIWPFVNGTWSGEMSSAAVPDVTRLGTFFNAIAWYNLVPSGQSGIGTLVTAGGGTFGATDYVTAAAAADGTLLAAYMPTTRTITVDMTKLHGAATARWYDPSRGTYAAVAGSPIANTGTHAFAPPGPNGAGDGDWLLLLQAQ